MDSKINQKKSINGTILIVLLASFVAFIIVSTTLFFFKLKPDALAQTAASYEKIFQEGLQKDINAKLSGASLIGIGVSKNQNIIDALESNNVSRLQREIQSIQNAIQQNSSYKGVHFQLISATKKTFFRTWSSKKGDDLSSVGIVNHAYKSKKVMTAEAIGKSGYFIRTVAPVLNKNNQIVGAISVHLGLGSIYRSYKKENIYYGLLLERNIVGNNFKPSDIVINERYVTANKKWFLDDFNTMAHSVDFDAIAQKGYVLSPKYFISSIEAKDSEGRIIGTHLIGIDRAVFNARLDTFQSSIGVIFIVFTMIFIATMFFIYFFMKKNVIEPLHDIQLGLQSFFGFINRESREAKTLKPTVQNEFGQMVNMINNNIQKIEKTLQLDNELIDEAKIIVDRVQHGWYSQYIEKSTSNEVLEAFKNNVNTMILATKKNFLNINTILEEYSNYDYRNDIVVNGIEQGGVFEKLITDINQLKKSITDMLLENKRNGTMLNTSANELLENVKILSSASNESAASLEETAAAVEEMNAGIAQNTQNVIKMSSYAKELSSTANDGEHFASQTTHAMEEINDEVTAISTAITVIDQISFQTNILSLNAAVEAATAGESGKGFAVVAQEVRNLAARSAEAANQIKTLVENATEKANKGKVISTQMITGYHTLKENISKTIELIDGIENASKEQQSSIIQINNAITLLDSQTQANAIVASKAQDIALTTSAIATKIVSVAEHKEFEGKHEPDRRKNPINPNYKGSEKRSIERTLKKRS